MKIERNNLEKSVVELLVEADVKEVSKYRKKLLLIFQKILKLKVLEKVLISLRMF